MTKRHTSAHNKENVTANGASPRSTVLDFMNITNGLTSPGFGLPRHLFNCNIAQQRSVMLQTASIHIYIYIYIVSQKKLCHFYFYCNFGKCWSIFKIPSMSESERNGSLKFGACLNSRLSTWLLISGAKDLIRACVRAKGGHFEHSL